MVDSFSSAKRSKIMRSIKSANTRFERDFRSLLWKAGLRYRVKNNLLGKPDLYFSHARIVVFLDSCFWHGCPEHVRLPKSNKLYWKRKIARNVERDRRISAWYKRSDWKLLRIWEHMIRNDLNKCAERIEKAVRARFTANVNLISKK